MGPNVHYSAHKSVPLISMMSHKYQVHSQLSCFCKIPFNIISSTSWVSKWTVSFSFSPPKHCMNFSCLPCVLHALLIPFFWSNVYCTFCNIPHYASFEASLSSLLLDPNFSPTHSYITYVLTSLWVSECHTHARQQAKLHTFDLTSTVLFVIFRIMQVLKPLFPRSSYIQTFLQHSIIYPMSLPHCEWQSVTPMQGNRQNYILLRIVSCACQANDPGPNSSKHSLDLSVFFLYIYRQIASKLKLGSSMFEVRIGSKCKKCLLPSELELLLVCLNTWKLK